MPTVFNGDDYDEADANALRRALGNDLPLSGRPPHRRAGHHSPIQPPQQPPSVIAIELLRKPPDEEILTT